MKILLPAPYPQVTRGVHPCMLRLRHFFTSRLSRRAALCPVWTDQTKARPVRPALGSSMHFYWNPLGLPLGFARGYVHVDVVLIHRSLL